MKLLLHNVPPSEQLSEHLYLRKPTLSVEWTLFFLEMPCSAVHALIRMKGCVIPTWNQMVRRMTSVISLKRNGETLIMTRICSKEFSFATRMELEIGWIGSSTR